MCRLYGFRSNAPRKVECELIRAQNALLAQSVHDERGQSNPHGWGLGVYENGTVCVEKQAHAAYDSDEFRWAAAQIHAGKVMAHVRRATVGKINLVNTHPFEYGSWLFAHNGNLGAFKAIRPSLLAAMPDTHRRAIYGDTDSEHVFHFLLSLYKQYPALTLLSVLRRGVRQVMDLSHEADPNAEVALNLLLSDGNILAGARLNRSLWFVERMDVHPCDVCGGALHVESDPGAGYRAVVVASEPITRTESWTEIPDHSLFLIDREIHLHIESL